MQRIADWLQKLGLGQYAQRFAENDIDIDVLNELSDQDFDRLGVSLGHRRKMLRATRELGASPVAAVTEPQAPTPTALEPVTKDTAELGAFKIRLLAGPTPGSRWYPTVLRSALRPRRPDDPRGAWHRERRGRQLRISEVMAG